MLVIQYLGSLWFFLYCLLFLFFVHVILLPLCLVIFYYVRNIPKLFFIFSMYQSLYCKIICRNTLRPRIMFSYREYLCFLFFFFLFFVFMFSSARCLETITVQKHLSYLQFSPCEALFYFCTLVLLGAAFGLSTQSNGSRSRQFHQDSTFHISLLAP